MEGKRGACGALGRCFVVPHPTNKINSLAGRTLQWLHLNLAISSALLLRYAKRAVRAEGEGLTFPGSNFKY